MLLHKNLCSKSPSFAAVLFSYFLLTLLTSYYFSKLYAVFCSGFRFYIHVQIITCLLHVKLSEQTNNMSWPRHKATTNTSNVYFVHISNKFSWDGNMHVKIFHFTFWTQCVVVIFQRYLVRLTQSRLEPLWLLIKVNEDVVGWDASERNGKANSSVDRVRVQRHEDHEETRDAEDHRDEERDLWSRDNH